MRILAIRGKNLASLAGEFVVDFAADPLGRAGLFAITGATGAGKSTLLDALCLALYNATPRLLRAGGKGVTVPDGVAHKISQDDPSTLLRRGTAEGYAEVDFLANDQQSYRARWQVRRAYGRSTGRLQNSEIQLFSLPALSNLGQGSKTETLALIQTKVGLNFQQFTRAVLLAQNDFATFLKASDDERADLLQTLTGTSSFSEISRHAYLRAKAEKEKLDQLENQLNTYALLDAEALQTKQAELAALHGERQQQTLTQACYQRWQQWHEQAASYTTKREAAMMAWQEAVRGEEAAAPRVAELAKINALYSLRPLWQAWQTRQTAVTYAKSDLTQAEQQHAAAMTAHQAATLHLHTAEQAQQQAKSNWQAATADLSAAKALAVEIASLQTQVTAADLAQQHSAQEVRTAEQQQQQAQIAYATAQQTQAAAEAWLQQHTALAPVVASAKYVQQGLRHANTCRDTAEAAHTAVQLAQTELARLQHASQTALTEQTQKATLFSESQTNLDEWQTKLAAFVPLAIQAQLDQIKIRRHTIQQVEQLGAVWQEKAAEHTQAATALAQTETALKAAETTLAARQAELPLLTDHVQQHHANLERAKLRLSDSAISLRQTLRPEQPCPVCGALSHPYHDKGVNTSSEDSAAQVILAGMAKDFAEAQAAQQNCLHAIHHEQGKAENLRQQATQQTAELARKCTASTTAAQAWQAALAELQTHYPALSATLDIVDIEANYPQIAAINLQLVDFRHTLATTEQAALAEQAAYQHTLTAREAALTARDAAQQAYAEAQQICQTVQTQIARTTHELAQATSAHSTAKTELAQQLHDLAEVLTPYWATWQTEWAANPAQFAATCATAIHTWQAQEQQLNTATSTCHTLALTLASFASTLSAKHSQQQQLAANYRDLANKLQQLHEEAAQFFAGQDVAKVEQTLLTAIAEAEQQLKHAHTAATQAQLTLHSATANLGFAQTTLASAERECLNAQTELKTGWDSMWDRLNQAIDQSEQIGESLPDDLHQLAHYFTHDPAALAAETAALQALRQTTSEARAVLLELEKHEQEHLATAPTAWTRHELAAAQTALHTAQEATQAAITAVEIALAQDQEKRTAQAATLAAHATQKAASQRWLRLGELIGSADGKKFRNFAQQLTLDLLLRHANLHLNDLARRYRLQRMEDSLGLLVVDQDMGDETRSVHSLSGGESFLVALALALGLASLSAQQVRVESLFIDEGFGSLDAESLDVAMAALEKLQAQGRKVGIISHVREMTERIPTRIHIQRQAGGRSRVVVEG